MNLSRRQALAFGGAAITVTLIPAKFAMASESGDAAIKAFTGGAATAEGGIDLISMI